MEQHLAPEMTNTYGITILKPIYPERGQYENR